MIRRRLAVLAGRAASRLADDEHRHALTDAMCAMAAYALIGVVFLALFMVAGVQGG